MKYYTTVNVRRHDEFTRYEGEDKQAAINCAIYEDAYLTLAERKNGAYTEVREYDIADDADEDTIIYEVCSGNYNMVEFEEE